MITSEGVASRRWLLAAMVVGAFLLAPALWNGFPLVFADTGEYFAWAFGVVEPRYRTLAYSAWLRIGSVIGTSWGVAVLQVGWVAAVTAVSARAVAPTLRARTYVLAMVAIIASTALPWVTSQLMPDIAAGLVAIAAATLVAAWPALGRGGRALLVSTVVVGGAMHVTHLVTALAVVAVVGHVVRLRAGWRAALVSSGATLGAVAGGAALAMALSAGMTGRAVISRNGHVFLMAHLVETGTAQRLLAEHCGVDRDYLLCSARNELATMNGEDFVWRRDSPFRAIGGWQMDSAEPFRMLRDAWREHPTAMMAQAVRLSAEQFAAVGTGDALRVGHRELLDLTFHRLVPADSAAYAAARQQRDTLAIGPVVAWHAAVAVLLWLVGLSALVARRRDGPPWELLVGTWTALVANAVIVANTAVVRDRYQARVLWVLAFALAIVLTAPRRRVG